MALWRVAHEDVTVGILAEEGGVVVVKLRAVQRLRRHDPCPRGVEQAAREPSDTGAHAPPTFPLGHERAARAGRISSRRDFNCKLIVKSLFLLDRPSSFTLIKERLKTGRIQFYKMPKLENRSWSKQFFSFYSLHHQLLKNLISISYSVSLSF